MDLSKAITNSILGGRVISVGLEGMYRTIADAISAAESLTPTVNSKIVLLLHPEIHTINTSITLPPYVDLIGISRDATIIQQVGPGSNQIYYTECNTISNVFIQYLSETSSPNIYALTTSDGAVSGAEETFFVLDNCRIEFRNTHKGTLGGAMLLRGNRYARISSCEIATTKRGIFMANTPYLHIDDSDIWLLNSDTNVDHIGIYKPWGGRLQMRGGKIATGYSPYSDFPLHGGIENESNQNIYGILSGSDGDAGSRIELFNIWCNVRNESGASVGIDVKAVCNKGETIVRLFGGYYQSENGTGMPGEGNLYDISNDGDGKVELIGNVMFSTSSGNIRGVSGTLGSTVSINSDTELPAECTNIYLIDSSTNNITITLPVSATHSSAPVIIRTSSANTVTIDARSRNINSSSTYTMPASENSIARLLWTGSTWYVG